MILGEGWLANQKGPLIRPRVREGVLATYLERQIPYPRITALNPGKPSLNELALAY
jgi:hypothetical protein